MGKKSDELKLCSRDFAYTVVNVIGTTRYICSVNDDDSAELENFLDLIENDFRIVPYKTSINLSTPEHAAKQLGFSGDAKRGSNQTDSPLLHNVGINLATLYPVSKALIESKLLEFEYEFSLAFQQRQVRADGLPVFIDRDPLQVLEDALEFFGPFATKVASL